MYALTKGHSGSTREPAGPHVVQRPAHQLRRDALALERGIGLGVREDDQLGGGDVLGERRDPSLDRAE